jgi:pantoate--beta-alanine ligase
MREKRALPVAATVAELRAAIAEWQRREAVIGMVPTMGALHAGHLSLVEAALAQCDRVVVTLFVNPRQFAPQEDLATYPRDEAGDRAKLEALGVDLLFAPDQAEMYPPGFDTAVLVGGPSAGLETDFRPHFFAGVATIVAKLLIAGLPDRAFFGEKDYQQLLVVRRLAGDLGIPTEIVGCPIVREPDGLALSSRNAYLSAEERARAPRLHAALRQAAEAINGGGPVGHALGAAREDLAAAGFLVDYIEVRDAATLAPAEEGAAGGRRLLAAAWLGRTRLIDNVAL